MNIDIINGPKHVVLSPYQTRFFLVGVLHLNGGRDYLRNFRAVISQCLWMLQWPRPRRSSLFENMTFFTLGARRVYADIRWQTCPTTGKSCEKMLICIHVDLLHRYIQMMIDAIKCLTIVNDMQKASDDGAMTECQNNRASLRSEAILVRIAGDGRHLSSTWKVYVVALR